MVQRTRKGAGPKGRSTIDSISRMRHRTASTLLALFAGATAVALVGGATALIGQSPEPKTAFLQAVGQFSLALDGAYGDEGARVQASLDAMARGLAEWDAVVRKYEAAMAADLPTAESPLATRMHLALAGLYLDRTRTTDGLRELSAARQLDQTRADVPLFEALAHSQLAGNHAAAATALRRASTLNGRDPITAYLLARNLPRTGPAEDAGRAYERFVANAARSGPPSQQPSSPPFTDLRLFHETPGVEPFFPPALYAEGFAELRRG